MPPRKAPTSSGKKKKGKSAKDLDESFQLPDLTSGSDSDGDSPPTNKIKTIKIKKKGTSSTGADDKGAPSVSQKQTGSDPSFGGISGGSAAPLPSYVTPVLVQNLQSASSSVAGGKAASHPTSASMVIEAITKLNEMGGSSLQAINKYIAYVHKVDTQKQGIHIRKALVKAVEAGKLTQPKGEGAAVSFKLAVKPKPAKKPAGEKKPKVKKAGSPKAKTPAAKKTAGAKKPASPKKKAATAKKPKAPKSPKKATAPKKAKSPAKPAAAVAAPKPFAEKNATPAKSAAPKAKAPTLPQHLPDLFAAMPSFNFSLLSSTSNSQTASAPVPASGGPMSSSSSFIPPAQPPTSPGSIPIVPNKPATNQPPPQPSATVTSGSSDKDGVTILTVKPATPQTFPTAAPPLPPNWEDHYSQSLKSVSFYKSFLVESTTKEYGAISKLVSSLKIISIEQIVNPKLWDQFTATRKEMLKAKADDVNLLSQLGLDRKEIERHQTLTASFTKVPQLTYNGAAFSPNEALLFHCTKKKENLEKILEQGLDERFGGGGLLGKGIYFSDNETKSIQYDGTGGNLLVFAVLLGDCLSVDKHPNMGAFVREPEKEPRQFRNFADKFFESITARPGGQNEYVIFNRNQCCPLYLIKYQQGNARGGQKVTDTYEKARLEMPAIAWRSAPVPPGYTVPVAMPTADSKRSWPFFASSLFKKMGADDVVSTKDEDDLGKSQSSPATSKENVDPVPSASHPATVTASASAVPSSSTTTSKKKILGGRTVTVVDSSSDSEVDLPVLPNKSKSRRKKMTKHNDNDFSESDEEDEKENCKICYNEYPSVNLSPFYWNELKCGHRVCSSCFNTIQKSGTTMTGIRHTFVKCPFCQTVSIYKCQF